MHLCGILPGTFFSWRCWDTCTLTNQAGFLSQTALLLYFRGNYQALTVQFQKCKFPEGRGGSESICLSSAVCRSIGHIPNPNSTSCKTYPCCCRKKVMQIILTGDAHWGLSALGGPQVAPGHTLAPIVLWPMEVLHLLPGDIDVHLPHFQAWWEKIEQIHWGPCISPAES